MSARHTPGPGRYAAVDALVSARLDDWIAELAELCRLPTEGGDAAALEAGAAWTARRLRQLGATVRVLRLPDAAPLVVGEIGEGPRTLIALHHYDVMPAGPVEAWTNPPYEPVVRDGRLIARGAADDKGAFLSRVWGVEAYLETVGALPCRVRFIVEGEEESGSANLRRHLDTVLAVGDDLRLADAMLLEGGATDMLGRPLILPGGRGMVRLDLTCRTLRYDAHSAWAMLLPNAAVRLAQAISSLYDARGLPAVVGLGGGIKPPTPAQLELLRATPTDDLPALRAEYGIEEFLGARDGFEALTATTFEPTLNVQGMWSGYFGRGHNNIVPAEAHARLDIRLVPDQDPDAVAAAVRDHLAHAGFSDIEVVQSGVAVRAWWTPVDHPLLDAAAHVSEAVFGRPAVRRVAESGTLPSHMVAAAHDLPVTSLGGGHEDCRAHAPDENFRLDHAAAGARIMARFLDAFAAMPARSHVSGADLSPG